MIRMASAASFVSLSLTLAACGGSNPSPTAPTAAANLAIDGRDAMLTGQVLSYRAIDSGAGTTLQATWTSSDASVATVGVNGLVTGLKQGSTRLEASFRGSTAFRIVQVVNSVEGLWDGDGTIRRCDEAGRFRHEWYPNCSGHSFVFQGQVYRWGGVGWVYSVVLRLSHDRDDIRRVSGTYDLRYLEASVYGHCDVYGAAVPLTGQVSSDGHLHLSGAAGNLDGGEQFTVAEWDTYIAAPGEMRGRWAQELTVTSGRSQWEVEVNLNAKEVTDCGEGFRVPSFVFQTPS